MRRDGRRDEPGAGAADVGDLRVYYGNPMKYTSAAEQRRQDDLKFYRKMRQSNECICERGKQPGMWFCFRCYKSLPADTQRALWGMMEAAVFEAYDEAVKYLGD